MNDDELRARFAELREEERAIVPPLRVAPRRRAWRLAVACAVLILVVIVLARRGHDEAFTIEDRVAAQRISAWRAPTDSLLATPGRELLATTPDIPGALPKGVAP